MTKKNKNMREETSSESSENEFALKRIIKDYSDQVKDADEKNRKLFKELTHQANDSMIFNLVITGLIFLLATITLFFCLRLIFQSQNTDPGFKEYVSFGGCIGSLIVILVLLFRNPIRAISQPFSVLVKLNLIFQAYHRQMNQADAIFKQLLLTDFGVLNQKEINQLSQKILLAVEEAFEQVNQLLEELE